MKVDGARHEAGFVEGNPASAIGDQGDLIDRCEGDHRNAATCGFVNDVDTEGGGCECMGKNERE